MYRNDLTGSTFKLRTGGPYRITRHPIYTGLLGMMLGTLMLAGGGRWLVPFPVLLVLFEIKIRIEERLMLAEFPGQLSALPQAGAPAGARPPPGRQARGRMIRCGGGCLRSRGLVTRL